MFQGERKYFFVEMRNHGLNQEGLAARIWNMEPGAERDALRAQYDSIYGADPNCLGWRPEQELPSYEEYILLRDEPCKEDLPRNLRAALAYDILLSIQNYIQDYCYIDRTSSLLYRPTDCFHGMENQAYFRQQVVWPMFGSTKSFHEFMLKFIDDIKEYRIHNFKNCKPMTIEDLLDYFHELGDRDAVRLVQLNDRLHCHTGNVLKSLNHIFNKAIYLNDPY